ncbi:hypothetical protein [Clostridium manihotivorum]|uniref:Uncharacterized protein n=1 Tax=Clostridium manihotivorum TaxID=2320868 RepID=A0A3R5QUL7_9CLOT|nr:hypothetical protein [Clostridium manihotivorum]QAA33018.1 hypothetical protein C1I91_15980 [Clostridium manihotivorum]
MYKTLNKLYALFRIIALFGFGTPLMGLAKGRSGSEALFNYNRAMYYKVSLIGILIAILSVVICIVLKKKIDSIECEIKAQQPYNAPVEKYKLGKSKYLVVFSVAGKKYEHQFESIEVKKVYDFKKGSFVRYRTYKGEVIPETFYLAIPKHHKGIKNKWAYLSENQ